LGSLPGTPLGFPRGLEAFCSPGLLAAPPSPAPCISGHEGSSEGPLAFKGKEGGMSGGSLRSICRPLAKAQPLLGATPPSGAGSGGAGQGAGSGVLGSRGAPPSRGAMAPQGCGSGTQPASRRDGGGMHPLRRSSGSWNSQGSFTCFGRCSGVPSAAGQSGTPLSRGWDPDGSSSLPGGMGEGSLPGTPVRWAGDPGGPSGGPRCRPACALHSHLAVVSHPAATSLVPSRSPRCLPLAEGTMTRLK